jgi:hypothetical protein
MIKNIHLFGLILLLFACTKSENKITELLPSELVAYVDDSINGITQRKIMGDYKYEAKFCSTDYMIANELRTDHIDDKIYLERKKDFENLQYFKLRISLADGSNSDVMYSNLVEQGDYFSRDSYLAFEFKNQIKLVQGDTLSCELYHFVNSHSVTPYADIIMAFKKTKSSSGTQLVINDVVFGSGLMKFYFKKEDIKNIPSIITEI